MVKQQVTWKDSPTRKRLFTVWHISAGLILMTSSLLLLGVSFSFSNMIIKYTGIMAWVMGLFSLLLLVASVGCIFYGVKTLKRAK